MTTAIEKPAIDLIGPSIIEGINLCAKNAAKNGDKVIFPIHPWTQKQITLHVQKLSYIHGSHFAVCVDEKKRPYAFYLS